MIDFRRLVRMAICSENELIVLKRVLAGFEQNRKHVVEIYPQGHPLATAQDYPSAWQLAELEKLEASL